MVGGVSFGRGFSTALATLEGLVFKKKLPAFPFNPMGMLATSDPYAIGSIFLTIWTWP